MQAYEYGINKYAFLGAALKPLLNVGASTFSGISRAGKNLKNVWSSTTPTAMAMKGTTGVAAGGMLGNSLYKSKNQPKGLPPDKFYNSKQPRTTQPLNTPTRLNYINSMRRAAAGSVKPIHGMHPSRLSNFQNF